MIWRINLLALGLGLMAACIPALAAGPSLVWEPPTTRVDGTPLASSEIDMYEICVTKTEGACVDPGPSTAPHFYEALSSPVPIESLDLPAGSWYFTIRTVDTTGLISEWATPVSYTIVAPPNPPTALQIE